MKAIIICPHTELPILAEIEILNLDRILCLHRDTREQELEDIRKEFKLVPDIHPLNMDSFDDMIDNLDEHLSDQIGETLFALPNTNKVKAILAKYQVEIQLEGTCWMLCTLSNYYGKEFETEIFEYLPCLSHNIRYQDYL